MDDKNKQFVKSLTSDLWATIYRKRKRAIYTPRDDFDLAAQINQPIMRPGWRDDLDYQDDVVKEVFREFVYHVEKVTYIPSN